MKTELDVAHHTPEGREAEAILRSCVHCGFCTATCRHTRNCMMNGMAQEGEFT